MFCGRTRTLYLLGIPYLLSLILLGDSARAQDASTGALRGVVVDAQGARVTRADIVAIRVETGIRYHAATDAAGRFTLDLLPPGDYVARAEAEGMSPQNSPRVEVEVGAATELTFKLSVAGVKETVTVSGAPKMVETDPGSVSVLLDERAITDLPLNGRRFTDLLLLAPGVTQDPRGLTSGSNGDLSYGGIRGYQSSYLVDGADNNNGFFAQARGRYRSPYQFSNEVVQEFRVSSSGYGAESGRAGGAVVNVVTKSGTNHWHGTGFYFLRDSLLSAAPAFVGFKPSDQQHQFGGTFGGPIQRNKTFFLAGFDQHIFHVPTVVEFLDGGRKVVPRAGTGPNDPGDYEICDPAVGGQSCDKDLVFASAAQLSTMGGTFHGKLLGNAGFLKVDHALTARHFLSARLSTSRYYGANNVFFDPASPITFSGLSGNGEEDVKTESVSLALLSNVSPRLTSHLRAQWSRDLQQSFPNATGVRTKIYNVMDGFGQATILPRETREHRLHLAETVSRSGGRHEWKFGGDAMFTWDFNYFPSIYGGEYLLRQHPRRSVDVRADARRHGDYAAARLGARCAPVLRAEFRQSGVASGQQRLRGVRAGHNTPDAASGGEPGSALRLADVWDGGDGEQSAVASLGQDAVEGVQFRAARGFCLCPRRPAAAGGARGIRHLLRAHSADLSVDSNQ